MSPLDNELRQALHRQAETISPPSDLFADVERQARRMRRNRVGAAVTGAALAVVAIAIAVPTMLPRTHHRPVPVSSSPDTPKPTASIDHSYDLDPASPWPYRGNAAVLTQGNLEAFRTAWTAKHPGTLLQSLFGEVLPSGQPELTFVAGVGTTARWGVVTATASGPQFLIDQGLAPNTRSLAAALPDTPVGRLLIVAAPAVSKVLYIPDTDINSGASRPMTMLAAGVAATNLDGNHANDFYQTFGTGGEGVDMNFAPDPAVSPPTGPTPSNVVAWPTRGTVVIATLHNAETAYATSRQKPVTSVETHVLYAEPSSDIVLAQMWVAGDSVADTVGFVGSTGELQLKSRLAAKADVVAMFVSGSPASGSEQVVVVPRPA
ncbi:MAG: hypothetical protein QOC73_1747, partial [Actinomycetota bacterium]|nr:hypothetical protein [Actinomycetota bacterium]